MTRARRRSSARVTPRRRAHGPWLAFCVALGTALALQHPQARANDADEIFLMSTRPLGTRCVAEAMPEGLACQQLTLDANRRGYWRTLAWRDFAAQFADGKPTIIYVHGNRVSPGADKLQGMAFYHSLARCRQADAPIRYVIWAWPADQIRGRLRDYQVKAARTGPVGWQLAWAVDALPDESPLTLIGYSYGARVVTGALHLLGGGAMGNLALPAPRDPSRPPLRAALVAAAMDAAWLRPGGYHGRALEQVDSMILVNNQLDPAMRFFHLPVENRHAQALGYAGVGACGTLGERVRAFDATGAVGRHHAIADYLSATPQLLSAWQQMLPDAGSPASPLPTLNAQAIAPFSGEGG